MIVIGFLLIGGDSRDVGPRLGGGLVCECAPVRPSDCVCLFLFKQREDRNGSFTCGRRCLSELWKQETIGFFFVKGTTFREMELICVWGQPAAGLWAA